MIARGCAVALLAAVLAPGQTESPVRGPVLGYVLDGAGLRPIAGMPGAAYLGAPVNLGMEIRAAAVLPSQEHALAAGADGTVLLIELATGLGREVATGGTDVRIISSPAGRSAVLVYEDPRSVRLITGLPVSPEIGAGFPLSEGSKVIAVSDDAEAILCLRDSSLIRVSRDGSSSQAAAGDFAAAAFLNNSRDVIAAERDGRVSLLREDGDMTPLASLPVSEIGEIAGVARADGDQRFLVAARKAVVALNREGIEEVVSCECAITGLSRLNGASVFRLTDLPASPMWLLDGNRTVFVPAGGVQQ